MPNVNKKTKKKTWIAPGLFTNILKQKEKSYDFFLYKYNIGIRQFSVKTYHQ